MSDNRREDYFAGLDGLVAPLITNIIKNKERPKTCEDKALLLYNMEYIVFPIRSDMGIIFVNKRLPCANSLSDSLQALGGEAGINRLTGLFARRYIYGASENVLRQAAAAAEAFKKSLTPGK